MPSWAGLSSVTPTTTTISRRDHGDGGDQHAHVRNGSGSDGHYYGKHNGDTHHIINDVNSSSSNINMPLSSSDIKGKGKGKALLPFQPLSQVTGAEGNHHHGPANGDTSNNTTDVMLSPEDGSDAESILEMTTEEAEALLWDAQVGLSQSSLSPVIRGRLQPYLTAFIICIPPSSLLSSRGRQMNRWP